MKMRFFDYLSDIDDLLDLSEMDAGKLILKVAADHSQILHQSNCSNTGRFNGYEIDSETREKAKEIIEEGLGWLVREGLIVLSGSDGWYRLTSRGKDFPLKDPSAYKTSKLFPKGLLHTSIEDVSRSDFARGDYQKAVISAMQMVEVRTRTLANLDNSGYDLMAQAFKADVNSPGKLNFADRTGDMTALRNLFTGSFCWIRNVVVHEEVHFDPIHALHELYTASYLMRLLDQSENFISGDTT
jgi:uncharacterized protein (TIGR02391 family)